MPLENMAIGLVVGNTAFGTKAASIGKGIGLGLGLGLSVFVPALVVSAGLAGLVSARWISVRKHNARMLAYKANRA